VLPAAFQPSKFTLVMTLLAAAFFTVFAGLYFYQLVYGLKNA